MGRRESPLVSNGDPLVEMAMWLREQRTRAGLTYDEMAMLAGYHKSTLSRAASGKVFPDHRHVEAYAKACGADVHVAREMWSKTRRKRHQSLALAGRRVDYRTPQPDLVVDAAELR